MDAAQAKGVQKLFVNTTREVIAGYSTSHFLAEGIKNFLNIFLDNIDSTEGRRSRSTRHSSNWHEASPFVNAKKSASNFILKYLVISLIVILIHIKICIRITV